MGDVRKPQACHVGTILAMFPLAAIPSYMRVAAKEEELLTRRFGLEYVRYQRTTGRFLPKKKGNRRLRN